MARKLLSHNPPYFAIGLTVELPERTLTEDQAPALLDTGFSGDVSIPPQMVRNGHIPPADLYADITVADGSTIKVPVYEGTLFIRELKHDVPQPLDVAVLVLGNEVIVGRGISNHFKVTLDHGKQLIIEP